MEKNCNNCIADKKELSIVTMSSADWQRNEQRHERREKRHIWVIVLLIVLLVASNIAWVVYENSFEEVITTEEIIVDADGNGNANYIGQDGNIYNGEDYCKENDQNP